MDGRRPASFLAAVGVCCEALYLRDPDENGLELYCDKPSESWPRTANGEIAMFTRPLDLEALLREAPV